MAQARAVFNLSALRTAKVFLCLPGRFFSA